MKFVCQMYLKSFDDALIDKLDTCCYSGRRMKTEGYWVEMACPKADMLLALLALKLCRMVLWYAVPYPLWMTCCWHCRSVVCYGLSYHDMVLFGMVWCSIVWYGAACDLMW